MIVEKTPMYQAWLKQEVHYQMTAEDHLLGGPRKQLTLKQFAKANGWDIKTGQRKK